MASFTKVLGHWGHSTSEHWTFRHIQKNHWGSQSHFFFLCPNDWIYTEWNSFNKEDWASPRSEYLVVQGLGPHLRSGRSVLKSLQPSGRGEGIEPGVSHIPVENSNQWAKIYEGNHPPRSVLCEQAYWIRTHRQIRWRRAYLVAVWGSLQVLDFWMPTGRQQCTWSEAQT